MQRFIDNLLDKYRNFALIFVALTITLVALHHRPSDVCLKLEINHADSFFTRRNLIAKPKTPEQVILVGIDSNTFHDLGASDKARLPRKFYTQLLQKLKALNVKAVGLDLVLRTQDDNPQDDLALRDIMKTMPVVLAASESKSNVTRNNEIQTLTVKSQPSALYSLGTTVASVDWIKDRQGVVRFFPSRHKTLPVFSAALAKLWNQDVQYPDSYLRIINYYGPKGTIESESFQNVLHSSTEKLIDRFKERIVLVGDFRTVAGHSEKADSFLTPFKSNEETFGTEIHATMLANILEGSWIRPVEPRIDNKVSAVLIFVITLVILLAHPVLALIFAALCWFGLDWISFQFFLKNQFFGLHCVRLLALGVVGLKIVIETYFYIRNNLSQLMHSEKVVDFLFRFAKRYGGDDLLNRLRVKLSQGEDIKFAAEETAVLVATYDIVGSSSLAIREGAAKAVEIESQIHTIVLEEIEKNHGLLKVIVGDAQMATWKTADFPDALEHAVLAFEGAVKKISNLNIKDLGLRLAVTAGIVADGDMECGTRAIYTINGDPVNRNSRIEKQAKQFGVLNILDQESVQFKTNKSDLLLLGKVITSEQANGLSVYTVLKHKLSSEVIDLWAQMQAAYEAKNWAETKSLSRQCAKLDAQLKAPAKRYAVSAQYYSMQNQDVLSALGSAPLRNFEDYELQALLKFELRECSDSPFAAGNI